jgi:carboxyl-terminal processing protease
VFFSKIDENRLYIVLAHFNKKASYETKQALEELDRELKELS